LLAFEEHAEAKGAGRPVVAVTTAVVYVWQKAEAEAKLLAKADAHASVSGLVHAWTVTSMVAIARKICDSCIVA